MNKIFSIVFFILVWFTCSGQTYTVFVIDSMGYNVGHITFKPDIQDGYAFYHLEHLGKEPFKGCTFIAEDEFSSFINAYNLIKNGEDFNMACEMSCLNWQENYTPLFFPTLIRTACSDCQLPEIKYELR